MDVRCSAGLYRGEEPGAEARGGWVLKQGHGQGELRGELGRSLSPSLPAPNVHFEERSKSDM